VNWLPEEKLTQSDIKLIKDFVDTTREEMAKENFDFVAFSAAYNRAVYGAYATPQMVNTNLQNINLNPRVSTYQEYLKALQNPKTNEDAIISFGQNEYLTNTLYKRNFDYYVNLPAFELSIRPKSAEPSDYSTTAYKKDWKAAEDFIAKFDYRGEFRKCVFNMLNSDIYSCMFRDDLDEDRYVLQDLSYKYVKIMGRCSYGLLVDVDMSFLMNGTQDLMMYPKSIRRKYNSLFNSQNKYVPSSTLNERTGKFGFYVQTSPIEDEIWTFKFNPDMITEIPYFAPMMLDTSLMNFYRELQMNQDLVAAKKLITSQWPLLEAKTAQTDRLGVKAETMGAIIGAIKSALGDSFNIASMPSDKIEVEQMENKNKTAYQDYLKNISGLMGGANTLFSVVKQSSTESMISADIDAMLMSKIYPQFESFLEYHINKRTKKFKFDIKLSGTSSYLEKDRKYKAAMDAAKVGLVSKNKLANALDMNVFELDRELEMTKGMGFTEKLMPMLNLFTMSGSNDGAGRPQSSDSEISESAQNTRSAGSNLSRGGKI
jgi:hypothetical protein